MDKYKVSEDVAVQEVLEFVSKFNRKVKDTDKVLDLYPDVVEAVRLGNFDLTSREQPQLKLIDPIKNTDGDVVLETVSFRTRMKPSDHRRVSKGIDVAKEQLVFGHRCVAFVIDQEVAMLDKFSKDDYSVIDQFSSLFI
jgi:hypothetical protein